MNKFSKKYQDTLIFIFWEADKAAVSRNDGGLLKKCYSQKSIEFLCKQKDLLYFQVFYEYLLLLEILQHRYL